MNSIILKIKVIVLSLCKRCLSKACHHNISFLRIQLIPSVYIISVHAQSCGHCRGCLRLLASPLFAGGWLHRFPRARKGAVFPFSHSPVPFLERQRLAGLLLLSSTSVACSGTTLSPWTKRGNKWKKERKWNGQIFFFHSGHQWKKKWLCKSFYKYTVKEWIWK